MKITIDHRYNHINFDWASIEEMNEINDWCDQNGGYTIYATGVVYEREQDLTAFMLRWAGCQ